MSNEANTVTSYPGPPLEEQRHVVAKLNSLRAKVHAAQALQAQAADEVDAMLLAILDKAFKRGAVRDV